MLGGQLHLAALLHESGAGNMTDGALGGGLVALIDIAANRTNILFHSKIFLPIMFFRLNRLFLYAVLAQAIDMKLIGLLYKPIFFTKGSEDLF
jgi:hypothetical protein